MDVLGVLTHVFHVPASLAKQLANRPFVVGTLLGSAPIAEVTVHPQNVQQPQIARGIQVEAYATLLVRLDITCQVRSVSTLVLEHRVI